MASARIWQAATRTDAGRLTEAESLCRAALAAGSLDSPTRARAHATLARVLLWQARFSEAAAIRVLPGPLREALADDFLLDTVADT